jgi:hypothetical protein
LLVKIPPLDERRRNGGCHVRDGGDIAESVDVPIGHEFIRFAVRGHPDSMDWHIGFIWDTFASRGATSRPRVRRSDVPKAQIVKI